MVLSSELLHRLDVFLFGALPYVAMTVFFIVTIQRYRQDSFTYSSLSSQFLENRQHFWSLVPFHYGLLVVLTGHVVAFLIPSSILAWNARPMRLYVLEVSALICGILTVTGLVMALARRSSSSKVSFWLRRWPRTGSGSTLRTSCRPTWVPARSGRASWTSSQGLRRSRRSWRTSTPPGQADAGIVPVG